MYLITICLANRCRGGRTDEAICSLLYGILAVTTIDMDYEQEIDRVPTKAFFIYGILFNF